MGDARHGKDRLRIADLNSRAATGFDLRPDEAALDRLRDDLDLLGLRKLRFQGALRPRGSREWELVAQLGATVVQPCVVTLAPVTTRIEEEVTRRYTPDFQHAPGAGEDGDGEGSPMPEDETLEPLPAVIDLTEVMTEALALSLPLYPRAEGAEMGEAVFAEEGKRPLRDEDVKPFAGLAGLRDKLAGPDREGD
ncbi:hypothetical protein OB2597_02442 [Pseudooceanicola batsensis HTCC2597]|uniref:50S ribosomal protein L34 n=1 Tax=Pseudooceanicola batsensis (strain ATCC BAA-863 / DSM 15984 / KCTC 12145 / HTCC2597) TaxID=252305 RepID=A3TX82_PSEBH|nr:DUF177 domain-containing protein [Pseudooceanicola batsensis]EAQ03442.1 hypothetical protein OB2597_02442 [Pseudooceanicola batsensis HTCC2597]